MPCVPFKTPEGVVGIACFRGQRRPKCATCGQLGAERECDGCDGKLCRGCAVSPSENVDFCPGCFEPVFRQFLASHDAARAASRPERRRLFRAYAQTMPHVFDAIPRSPQGGRS